MITYLLESVLDKLELMIDDRLENYHSGDAWIGNAMGLATWSATVELDSIELPELSVSADPDSDVGNIIALHSATNKLPLRIAADDRFWSYQTHVTYWDYMRTRWPVEGADDAVAFVRSRYFLATGSRERALVRNGVARLWWYGQTAYDPSLHDPYELVPYMMATQDVATALVERSISRCPKVALAVLHALKLEAEEGRPFRKRESFRA